MTIRIDGIERLPSSFELQGKEDVETGSGFDSLFNAALDTLNRVNADQLAADHAQTELATGQTDDVLSVMLAQERAYTSLNFTVQITNKIIESYREIMRMQV